MASRVAGETSTLRTTPVRGSSLGRCELPESACLVLAGFITSPFFDDRSGDPSAAIDHRDSGSMRHKRRSVAAARTALAPAVGHGRQPLMSQIYHGPTPEQARRQVLSASVAAFGRA